MAAVAPEYLGEPTVFAGLSVAIHERVGLGSLAWANTIVVREKRAAFTVQTPNRALLQGKRLICLDSPNTFEFMQPESVELVLQGWFASSAKGSKPTFAALCPDSPAYRT